MTSTSRTTRALLAGTVAVGAAFALAVPLVSPAHAAHINRLALTPDSASGAAGTCLPFTVTLTPQPGAATSTVAGESVDVVLTEMSGEPSAPATQVVDADFCNTATGTQAPDAGTGTDAGAAGTGDRAEFTTNADGTVTFGVTSTSASTISVFAFYDVDDDNVFDAGEPNDAASTATFGAGGPAGSNDVQNAVQQVDAPQNVSGFAGEPVSIDVVVRNAANNGQTLAGVTVSSDITNGPNAAVNPTCTASNNNGVATCTYTPTATGTDTVLFWVNQNDGPTPGFDPTAEPSDTTTSSIAAAVTGLQVDLVCTPSSVSVDTSAEDCVNFTNDPTQTFTATVTRADSNDPGSDRDPVANTLVRFGVTGTGATIDRASCTTDAAGTCTVTVTDANATAGETITVTASVAGQDPANDPAGGEITNDSATLRFTAQPTSARRVTITPDNQTTVPGGVATFTATVTDASGQPVRNVQVTFTESGAGFFRTPTTGATNAAGQFVVESTSSPAETGLQTVTATIDQSSTDCELVANNPNTGTPQGSCSDSATNTFSNATPTPTSSPTSPTPTQAPPSTSPPTGPPSPQPSCPGGATVVSLRSNLTQITAGNSPTLTGTVNTASGAVCGGVSVTIFKQSFGESSYTPVATVTTNQNGQFALVVRPLVQTSYGANTANNAVRSNIVNIRVYTRVNINSPATSAIGGTPVNNPVTFSGNLFPGYGNIAVGLGTLVNGRFIVLQQTRSDASGNYALTRTLPRGTGVYIIFVSAVSQGSDKGSKSITLTVR